MIEEHDHWNANVLIREGYLRTNLSNGFYWITEAAARFGLDRVLGKAFPK